MEIWKNTVYKFKQTCFQKRKNRCRPCQKRAFSYSSDIYEAFIF